MLTIYYVTLPPLCLLAGEGWRLARSHEVIRSWFARPAVWTTALCAFPVTFISVLITRVGARADRRRGRRAGAPSRVPSDSCARGPHLRGRQTTWANGQVSEWCGELISTGHLTMQALAQRFQPPLDDPHAAQPPARPTRTISMASIIHIRLPTVTSGLF